MVGVPDFSIWPANPKSLTVSPICCFLKELIIRLPMTIENSREKIKAIEALNEIKSNNPAPGKFN